MTFDDTDSGHSSGHKSIEDWNAKFGGEEGLDPFASDKGKTGYDFEMDVAYLARIHTATLVRSKRGDEQIRLRMEILSHDAEDAQVVGESLEHITMPWQESDKSMERGVRQRVLQMRVDTLKRLFSAAAPSLYAPYDRTDADPATQKKRYLDFDGTVLTKERYADRQADINDRVMQVVESIKDKLEGPGGEVEELGGCLIYLHKKPNQKNADYPYTNFYATRPSKLPVFGSGAAF